MENNYISPNAIKSVSKFRYEKDVQALMHDISKLTEANTIMKKQLNQILYLMNAESFDSLLSRLIEMKNDLEEGDL